jgi:hypothetical protein
MPWIGGLAMPGKLSTRKDDQAYTCDDKCNTPADSDWREETFWKMERYNQLQRNGCQERNAKNNFGNLPPAIMRGIHRHSRHHLPSLFCPAFEVKSPDAWG